MDESGCRKTNAKQVEKQMKAGVKSGGGGGGGGERRCWANEAGEKRKDQPSGEQRKKE